MFLTDVIIFLGSNIVICKKTWPDLWYCMGYFYGDGYISHK